MTQSNETKTPFSLSRKLSEYQAIAHNGLWDNNQALVALLGLCPLLAVTNNTVNGLGLGLATMTVLFISNLLVSLVRNHVASEIRIPAFIAIIASAVTAIDLWMEAYLLTLHHILGIFIPLIVTNCAILGRAEAFASKNSVDKSLVDAFFVGLGFTLVLVVLGSFREIIGSGTLFAQMDLLFGETARSLKMSLPDDYHPILMAILPPGAFIGLGLLIALKNTIAQRQSELNKQTSDITEVSADIKPISAP